MKRRDLKVGDVFRYSDSALEFEVVESGHNSVKGYTTSDKNSCVGMENSEVILTKAAQPKPPEPREVSSPIDPDHYKLLKPEPIDVTEGWELNPNLASVVWYIARAGKKTPDARTDLLKARRFLSREIARLEGRRAWE